MLFAGQQSCSFGICKKNVFISCNFFYFYECLHFLSQDEMHSEFLKRCAVHSITAPPPPSLIQKHTAQPKFSSEPIKTRAFAVQHVSEGPKRHEPMQIAPTRCLSPSSSRQGSRLDRSEPDRALPDGDTRISINRTSVRKISLKNSELQKVSPFTQKECKRKFFYHVITLV